MNRNCSDPFAYWGTWAFVGFALLVVGPTLALGESDEEDWGKLQQQLDSAEQGENCSIFKELKVKEELRLGQSRQQVQSERVEQQEKRLQLEKCVVDRSGGGAQKAGVGDEARAAEICPTHFKVWQKPTYRLAFLKNEISEAQEAIRILNSQIIRHCRISFISSRFPLNTTR